MKVFKMNDYDWVASPWTAEETKEWYLKECGIAPEDNPEEPEEVSLEETMWDIYSEDDYEDIYNQLLHHNRTSKERKPLEINGQTFVMHDGVNIKKPLKDVIDYDVKEPYIVASTEW
jgi:hypothetical protein